MYPGYRGVGVSEMAAYHDRHTMERMRARLGRADSELRTDQHFLDPGSAEGAAIRGGDELRRLRLRSVALRRAGAPHPRSWVDGLPVVRQRRPPSGSLPILHDPPWAEHRYLEASLMDPSEWKGCSKKFS
jgi:hypothetical protein